MPLHKFRPEAILGVASPYYWTFKTKLDNKFNELLARLPPPPPAAPNAPLQQKQ